MSARTTIIVRYLKLEEETREVQAVTTDEALAEVARDPGVFQVLDAFYPRDPEKGCPNCGYDSEEACAYCGWEQESSHE